jgi:hypothetical protein
MPLTVRRFARAAALLIGCAAAALLGLVAISRSDIGSGGPPGLADSPPAPCVSEVH